MNLTCVSWCSSPGRYLLHQVGKGYKPERGRGVVKEKKYIWFDEQTVIFFQKNILN